MNSKKIFFFIVYVSLFFNANSQKHSKFSKVLSVEFGLSLVDNSGNRDPLTIFKENSEIAFKLPFTIEIDYLLSSNFELYLSGSSNKFSGNQKIDSKISGQSYNYFSIDFGAKYAVLGRDIFSTTVVGFVKAGIGMFKVESLGFSANIGAGGIIHLSESIDFVVSSVAKFAVENEYLNSNHFQHFIGLKYSFISKRVNCFCPRTPLNY